MAVPNVFPQQRLAPVSALTPSKKCTLNPFNDVNRNPPYN